MADAHLGRHVAVMLADVPNTALYLLSARGDLVITGSVQTAEIPAIGVEVVERTVLSESGSVAVNGIVYGAAAEGIRDALRDGDSLDLYVLHPAFGLAVEVLPDQITLSSPTDNICTVALTLPYGSGQRDAVSIATGAPISGPIAVTKTIPVRRNAQDPLPVPTVAVWAYELPNAGTLTIAYTIDGHFVQHIFAQDGVSFDELLSASQWAALSDPSGFLDVLFNLSISAQVTEIIGGAAVIYQ